MAERQEFIVEDYMALVRERPCFVCGLVSGDRAFAHELVYEDELAIAFLNKFPPLAGYVLVCPKAHLEQVTGDFTLHGVTRPLTLDATFNGGYAAGGMDPSGARIGFSAQGKIKRSDFGVSYGVPAPGTHFGVGDEVEILIETEFTQPGPAAAKPAG